MRGDAGRGKGRRGQAFAKRFQGFDYSVLLPAIARLPARAADWAADRRGDLQARIRREGFRNAVANLRRAMPEIPRPEAERLIREHYRTVSRDEMETFWAHADSDFLDRRIRFRGLEVLESARRDSRGAIFSCSHIGSTALVLVALGRLGFRMNMVFRALTDVPGAHPAWRRYGDRRIRAIEDAVGRPTLHTERSNYFTMRRRLREGEIVLLALDVVPTLLSAKRLVDVRFFGHPARFPEGIGRLRLETGARLLEWRSHRIDGRHEVDIVDLTPRVEHLTERQPIVQFLVSRFEADLRRYPRDWHLWDSFDQFLPAKPREVH